jgi:hypothetical protein
MHQMTLLKSENQILRQANKTLSRQRRAKRTYLRNGGKMTLDEGREAMDQKDVNTQLVAESSRNHSQRGSARPKERRCGICSKTGHNARTCQVVIEVSGEEYSD